MTETKGFMGWAKDAKSELTLNDVERKILFECPVCGGKFREYIFHREDAYQCGICGGNHLVIDDWGFTLCLEHVDEEYVISADESVDMYCSGCHETFDHHPDGTIIAHLPDGAKFRGTYLSPLLRCDWADCNTGYDVDFCDLDAGVQDAILSIVKGSRWVSTDPWRGYNDPGKAPGYTCLLDGWAGMGGDGDMVGFINGLEGRAVNMGIPFIVVFTTTSNVCSTGVSVYVPAEQVERLKATIEAESISPHLSESYGGGMAGYIGVVA